MQLFFISVKLLQSKKLDTINKYILKITWVHTILGWLLCEEWVLVGKSGGRKTGYEAFAGE